MKIPSEQEINAALDDVADPMGNGRWRWPGGANRPHDESRAIVRMCLMLGTEVSDYGTTDLFVTLVDRLAEAEARIARLEQHLTGGALGS